LNRRRESFKTYIFKLFLSALYYKASNTNILEFLILSTKYLPKLILEEKRVYDFLNITRQRA
jgi:hypothetical protein